MLGRTFSHKDEEDSSPLDSKPNLGSKGARCLYYTVITHVTDTPQLRGLALNPKP